MPVPDEDRLRALADRLSLAQKVRLLTGADLWSTHQEPAVGLRRLVVSDGPAGVRGEVWDERDPSVSLPCGSALGASWDVDLAYTYGTAIAAECRRKGVDVSLGPTINLHRSPLGGRHFESYSEDPLLTGMLAAACVRGLQDHGVAANPKHYVANDSETERFTLSVVADERTLREVYLLPFEHAVAAGAWSVMSAYNAVDGVTMTENDLLERPLSAEWSFDGLVISDWTAVRSTEPAARAMQDLAMPGPNEHWGDALVAAVEAGRVPETAIDEKVVRLLRLAARVGALEDFDVSYPESTTDPVAGARSTAAEGTVLVRNEAELPWPTEGPRSVAVIGEAAATPRIQGGGSATVMPTEVVDPLNALRAALPASTVTYHRGVPVELGITPLPLDALTDPATGDHGVRVRYLDDDGREVLNEQRLTTRFVWLGTLPAGTATVEMHARYVPTETGALTLGATYVGEATLVVDGQQTFSASLAPAGDDLGAALLAPPMETARVQVTAGTEVDLRATFHVPGAKRMQGSTSFTLGTTPVSDPPDRAIAEAAAAARQAEVALVFVGTTAQTESEGYDRTTLELPGAQDDLVRAVAAANPRTIVVVNAGSPVLMPWREEVAAILLTWFGGQQIGNALADVLLGKREPGGRLPTTWPATEDDVPVLSTTPVGGELRYDEGVHVGHRGWLRAGATPAYPFGYGLGYTTWRLSDLVVSPHGDENGVRLAVDVHNTGPRTGKQVVQVYLSRAETNVDRPARWLAGFATARVEPGGTRTVEVVLPRRAFAHWDDGWKVEPGTFAVHVGTNVLDLPLSAEARP